MNEFRVGLLAIVAIAMGVFMSLKITSNQSGFGDYVKYRTVIADAAGVFPKTPIKVAGINAGRINKIELADHQALITFEVLKSITISKNSVLRVKSVGFLGDKYLDIFLGADTNERLAEGALVPSETAGGLEDLTKDASELMADLKTIMGSIKEAVNPDNGEMPIRQIVKNLQDITENVKEVTDSARRLVSDNEDKLARALSHMDKLMANLSYEFDGKEDDSLMHDLKTIGPILADLKIVTSDIQVMVADLKAGRGTIGKLMRDEQVIDQVNETLSGVNKIVNKVNNLQTELSLYSGMNTESDGRTGVDLTMYPAPERLYRIGIITSELGPERSTLITTHENDGAVNHVTRDEQDKNSYKFNIQIGRRIHDFSFRAGLIESSGGVGIDYQFNLIGTKLSFEAFDYNRVLGPNLRLTSEFEMWNVFYGRVAYEDMISKLHEQSWTLGAGVRFSDEDLKGIIGFFF